MRSPSSRPGILVAVVACVLGLGLALPAASSADETVWLCKPKTQPNPCKGSLETTVYSPSGESHAEKPRNARRPKADCFYVYPTVSEDPGANSDRQPDDEEFAVAEYQASRFSQVCRVYAPMYRQRTLAAIAGPEEQNADALRLAFTDIRAAWRDYLRNYNRGRGFVLIGHSQGTTMLRALMRERIDDRRGVRRRLVSALLLGANATAKKGELDGGDFDRIPACASKRQNRCVIAWSAFDEPPPEDSRFGRPTATAGNPFDFPTGPRYEVICTDPSELLGEDDPLGTLVPSGPYPGVIGALLVGMWGPPPTDPTPWVRPEDHYAGRCEHSNGAHVLMIEPLGDARNLREMPDDNWGLHLADVNIALGELVRITRSQIRAYTKARRRG